MKNSRRNRRKPKSSGRPAPLIRQAAKAVALVAAVLGVSSHASATDLYTQSVTLNPGWNAVHVLVTPATGDPATVFAGVPLEGVWTFASAATATEFLLDPAELDWNRAGWLGYRTAPEQAVLNNLHLILGNRVYLIEIGGTARVNWSITGVPASAPTRWVPDSWNLVGLPVDPGVTVTLGALLQSSPAHLGQPIWEFDAVAQTWVVLSNPATRAVAEGDAFWIYTDGPSTYQGPWELDLVRNDGIDFGRTNGERRMRITNRTGAPRTVRFAQIGSSVPLTVKIFDVASKTFRWEPLANMSNWVVPASGSTTVTLAVQRQEITVPEVATLLAVTDGQGTRRLVAVRAGR